MQHQTGVLLVNVGTPDAPQESEVREYLREFLSDPRVIDELSSLGRWLLLNLIILRRRPAQSAEAYRAIWTDEGSPLLLNGIELRDGLRNELGDNYQVELGMRYGLPSLSGALDRLMKLNVDRLVVVPLFPQYASAASGTVVARVMEFLRPQLTLPQVEIRGAFYDDVGFIESLVTRLEHARAEFEPDAILFSYHGLPEHQVVASEAGEVACDRRGPCPAIGAANRLCYRAQCYATSRLLADAVGLSADDYTVSFQSRLGAKPWIQPYTDEVVSTLRQQGAKRLLVTCPSFVSDCLETLEEIDMRLREQWLELGGEAFAMAPALNAHPAWVRALGKMVRG